MAPIATPCRIKSPKLKGAKINLRVARMHASVFKEIGLSRKVYNIFTFPTSVTYKENVAEKLANTTDTCKQIGLGNADTQHTVCTMEIKYEDKMQDEDFERDQYECNEYQNVCCIY